MEVGAWMETNQEAIYGTLHWKVHHDKEPAGGAQAPVDIRFTAKGNSVYAICLAWPEKDVLVRALGNAGVPDKAISAVRMLGSKEVIKWRQTNAGLTLSVPEKKPCRYAFVYRIDFKKQ
jgi:alpha-L-fucosidase